MNNQFQANQEDQGNHDQPKRLVRFQGLRKSLAAVGGVFEVFTAMPPAIISGMTAKENKSTFGWIIQFFIYVGAGFILGLENITQAWIREEERAIANEQRQLNSKDEQEWGAKTYLSALSGFFLGLLYAPFAAIEAAFNTPHEGESLWKTIFMAPIRAVSAFFSSPFDRAEEWAQASLSEIPQDEETEIERLRSHYELGTVTEYLQMVAALALGFLAGCLQAPFKALHATFNPPKSENFWLSLLKAPYRFLTALFNSPFYSAELWAESLLEDLDNSSGSNDYGHKALESLTNYLYITGVAIKGFITGILSALPNAVGLIFDPTSPWGNDRYTPYSLLDKLIRFPLYFFRALLLTPFKMAYEAVEVARTELDANSTPIEPQVQYQKPSFAQYGLAVLKGAAAVVISIFLSPMVALLDFFGQALKRDHKGSFYLADSPYEVSENLYSSIFFAPLHFLEVMFRDAYARVMSWVTIEKVPVQSNYNSTNPINGVYQKNWAQQEFYEVKMPASYGHNTNQRPPLMSLPLPQHLQGKVGQSQETEEEQKPLMELR